MPKCTIGLLYVIDIHKKFEKVKKKLKNIEKSGIIKYERKLFLKKYKIYKWRKNLWTKSVKKS
jgi:hypothetical protein